MIIINMQLEESRQKGLYPGAEVRIDNAIRTLTAGFQGFLLSGA